MRCLAPWFTVTAPRRIGAWVAEPWGRIVFRELTPEQALSLWRTGHPCIGITEEGVAHFLSEETDDALIALVAQCRTLPDLEALYTLRKGVLKRAYQKRKKQLEPPTPAP